MTFNCLLNSFFKDCEHKCIDAKLSNFVTTNITTLLSIDNVVYANEDELKKRWVSLFTNASSNADVTV
ncbi:hypothetical protein BDF14DRAFT_1804156 [Spinellus fusiger]|nr:hypothetical protein BDF14DRAFT_1804156 [Spinellus fusiger]